MNILCEEQANMTVFCLWRKVIFRKFTDSFEDRIYCKTLFMNKIIYIFYSETIIF